MTPKQELKKAYALLKTYEIFFVLATEMYREKYGTDYDTKSQNLFDLHKEIRELVIECEAHVS